MIVSIIMLVYNHANYLPKAIESVMTQLCEFDIELIIGEDCSTDGSRRIALAYKNRFPDKIKLLLPEKNLGALLNEEKCISIACGDYIAFLEGDDYWIKPDKLQKQVDFLKANPEYGMVHTDAHYFYQKECRLIKNYNKTLGIHFPSGDIFAEYMKGKLFIKTATVLVRRELLLAAANFKLFREKQWLLTDLPIWLYIAANSKIKYFEETTATYRLIEESESRTIDPWKKHRFHLSVFDIRYYYWNKYSKDSSIKIKLDLDFCRMLMGDAFKMNDLSLANEAIRHFRKKGVRMILKDRGKYLLISLRNLLGK